MREKSPRTSQAFSVSQQGIPKRRKDALLIHLTGGRIETHFHIFGSLAFLSFYRDWRVLVPATIVVVADHFFRGVFWPESVYGVCQPAHGGGWSMPAGCYSKTFFSLSLSNAASGR
jgi:hypothetical protein